MSVKVTYHWQGLMTTFLSINEFGTQDLMAEFTAEEAA
jgi:hypothetical protein